MTPVKPPGLPLGQYRLDAERYAEVDDELQLAAAYFARLCDELWVKTVGDGITALMAENMVTAIHRLRFELKRSQEPQAQRRIIRQRLYGRGET